MSSKKISKFKKKFLLKIKTIIGYLYFFKFIFIVFLGTSLIFIGNKITKTKGKPSKYNKRKSIGIFISHINEKGQRDCREIARGMIGSKGDVYVFPNLKSQKEFPFHESFHKSGKHHWKEGDQHFYPLAFDGEGLPASEKQKNFRFNLQSCFCFRKGKGLNANEIKILVEKLIRYVPFTDSKEIIAELKNRGICQIRNADFKKDLWKRWKIFSKR